MLHIGICDDSNRDRAALRTMLGQTPGLRRATDLRVSEYTGGEQLLLDAEDGRCDFDLLFLDIFMDGISGMETARQLRAMGCKFPMVFLTTSPAFALESYDVDAAGYLLKPLQPERLTALVDKLFSPAEKPKLAIKCAGRRHWCAYDEILYLESDNNVTHIHLVDGQTLTSRERLNAMEQALRDPRFLRCHQSYLVNMDYIQSAERDFAMQDGTIVPIRAHSRKEMTDAYYQHFVSRTMTKLPREEDAYV